MDTQTLQQIGLSETQARAYIALVQHGQLSPPALAQKLKETRSNAYKILDKLVELGLAKKLEIQNKFIYRVENPTALESLAIKARNNALTQEKKVRDAMPTLLNYFYTFSEQPGVRFFYGVDGIKEILQDTLRVRKDIYILRTWADDVAIGTDYWDKYRAKRARLGIQTHLVLTDNPGSRRKSATDASLNISRTWLPANSYTAPVELDVYGDRAAIISYGEEAMGILIESPQIAESFRQILQALSTAQHYSSAKKRIKTAASSA